MGCRTMQVNEQMLKALGITKCAHLIASRGLLGALYSSIATDHFMAVGLGIGATMHGALPKEGEAGRKGMSVERTFAAISLRSDLEAKVSPHIWAGVGGGEEGESGPCLMDPGAF